MQVGIFAWIVLGAIAGFAAGLLSGDRWGIFLTIGAGIAGGLLGGYLASAMFHNGDVSGITAESVVIAVAGALVLIVLWDAYSHGSRRSHA
jgi:uncharacterized membrane protein YeaQ/YmgE (transglycosylase-associated protein family)